MHIAYTPIETRQRAAAHVRAFCDVVDALTVAPATPRRRLAWDMVLDALAATWRHVRLLPANDR